MSKISNRVVGTLSTSSGSIRATAAGVSNTWLGVDWGGLLSEIEIPRFPSQVLAPHAENRYSGGKESCL